MSTEVCCYCAQGMCASIHNYNSRIVQLDQDSLKQMEIIYNQVTPGVLYLLLIYRLLVRF